LEIHDPDLSVHSVTYMALQSRQIKLTSKVMYSHVLKTIQLSAHTKSRDL